MKFTYDAYKKMIDDLRRAGYTFAGYESQEGMDRVVILRHDIDYCLNKAVKMAELEQASGVRSTYFVLLKSSFYNLLAAENLRLLKRIKELGHDIGLHFDELSYTNEYYDEHGGIRNVILEEVKLLEQVSGIAVNSVSMHRPSRKTLESDIDLSPVINSYGKYFFKGFKYVSDSRRRWREDVDGIIASAEYDRLHILTHAFWYNDKEKDLRSSLEEFIKDGMPDRYRIMNDNFTDLEEVITLEDINNGV